MDNSNIDELAKLAHLAIRDNDRRKENPALLGTASYMHEYSLAATPERILQIIHDLREAQEKIDIMSKALAYYAEIKVLIYGTGVNNGPVVWESRGTLTDWDNGEAARKALGKKE